MFLDNAVRNDDVHFSKLFAKFFNGNCDHVVFFNVGCIGGVNFTFHITEDVINPPVAPPPDVADDDPLDEPDDDDADIDDPDDDADPDEAPEDEFFDDNEWIGRTLVELKRELGRPRGVLRDGRIQTWLYDDYEYISDDGKTISRVAEAGSTPYAATQ